MEEAEQFDILNFGGQFNKLLSNSRFSFKEKKHALPVFITLLRTLGNNFFLGEILLREIPLIIINSATFNDMDTCERYLDKLIDKFSMVDRIKVRF